MVVVKIQGGLGNQLFQYAAARGLTKGNGLVYTDLQFLESNQKDTEHFSARNYGLRIFKNIRAKKASVFQVDLFKGTARYYRLLRAVFKSSIKQVQQIENEMVPTATLSKSHYLYLDGYFQSEKYFKHIRTQLLAELQFPLLDAENELIKKKILAAPNAVSVHLRRGDYVTSSVIADVLPVLPQTYYQKALDALQSSFPDIKLFIFSDDMDWVKQHFKRDGIQMNYVEQNTASASWKDLALMSYCKHHIIANSSFSWWGAWLAEQTGANFAPNAWFNSKKINFDIHDIVPETWTIIDCD